MWQAVSGPFLCSWKSELPAAKYSSAAQAMSASARRITDRPKVVFRECMKCTLV
jgi:hypothetical protein